MSMRALFETSAQWRRALPITFAALLAGSGLSCAPDMDDMSVCASEQPAPLNACSAATIPIQLGFAWGALSHRISAVDFQLDYGCGAKSGRAEVVGGDSSSGGLMADDAQLRWTQLEVDSAELGDCGPRFGRLSLDAEVRAPDFVVRVSRLVSRSAHGLRPGGDVQAVIQGFAFDTRAGGLEGYPEDYDPRQGYATRGYGIEVHVRSLSRDELEVIVDVRFEPGLSHDRADHNRAIEFAAIAARVDVLLVNADRSGAHLGAVQTTQEAPAPPIGRDTHVEPPDEQARLVELRGRPGAGPGFWGWRKFDFVLAPPENCTKSSECAKGNSCEDGTCSRAAGVPGYYIRELSVELAQLSYDHESGVAVFDALGYASNATRAVELYALDHRFKGEFLWWPGSAAAVSREHSRSFESGQSRWPADVSGRE